jgi:hypothetical protein
MADDAVKKAVGYGFDASLRKGTMAGYAAMRGSSEYLALDSKGKDAADNLFKDRIQNDKNLKSVKGIGDEKVSVYRKAAQEKPSRAIDYNKEFGPKPKAAPKAASKAAPASKYKKVDIGGGLYKYEEVKATPTPKATPLPTPKAAPKATGSGVGQMMDYRSLGQSTPKKSPPPVAAKKAPVKSSTSANPIRKALGIGMPGGGMRDSFMGAPAKKK